MSHFIRLLPVLALLAPGCAGSVKVDEIESFGLVTSAIWIHLETDDFESHSIVLSNQSGLCTSLESYYSAYQEFEDAVEEASENIDDFCEEMEEPYADYADASSTVNSDGARYLNIAVNNDGESEPEEEEYEVGDDPGFGGGITYYTGDLLSDQLEDFDPDGDAADNCGVDPEDFDAEDYYEAWFFDDGDLAISSVSDEDSVKGEFTVDLVTADEDEDDAGTATGKFSATYCHIEL